MKFFKFEPEVVIDACLVTLSIISYSIVKRPKDLMPLLNQLISENLEKLIVATPLIKTRLCLFFGYYFDCLFNGEE